MFRFSIRDVLWLTVVVGLATCWYKDRLAIAQLTAEMKSEKAAEITKLHNQRADLAREQAFYAKLSEKMDESLATVREREREEESLCSSHQSPDISNLDLPREAERGIYLLDTPRVMRLQVEGMEDSATFRFSSPRK